MEDIHNLAEILLCLLELKNFHVGQDLTELHILSNFYVQFLRNDVVIMLRCESTPPVSVFAFAIFSFSKMVVKRRRVHGGKEGK